MAGKDTPPVGMLACIFPDQHPRVMHPTPRFATVALLVSFLVFACAHGPSARQRAAETARINALAAAPVATTVSAAELALLAQTGPTAARAALAISVRDPEHAVELIEKNLPPNAASEVVSAAAMGLGTVESPNTERVLLALALRPEHPPAALEALFVHYRTRKPPATAPATLPDANLLAYARHPEGRGRAALAQLGRAVKDPALIPVMRNLLHDTDFEVRRAAAYALAEGSPKHERPAADRAQCLELLSAAVNDRDEHVVTAAARAASSYDDPRAVGLLTRLTSDPHFNVRCAALEGLGRRKVTAAVPRMLELARTDPSVSVRNTAAEQIASLDPAAGQALVDSLLADPHEYVRAAGVDLLAKSTAPNALDRLATLARENGPVRVRESAVDAFGGHTDSLTAKHAIRIALSDGDPGVVSTACGVVAKNKWIEFESVLEALPDRFPLVAGADVRAAAIDALSQLNPAAHHAMFEAATKDPNPNVRETAQRALAGPEGKPAPASRGADLTGTLLPGGAPIFGPDVFLVLDTDQGKIRIRLLPQDAPVHCAHVAALARNGFYDGLTWHRVVPDFVIQGGCPRGDGSGSATVTLPLEPTRIPFQRGTLGMPRSSPPDTGGCQLFICHSRAPHLDVAYTAFGQVVDGFDVIDRIDVDSKILHATVEGAQ